MWRSGVRRPLLANPLPMTLRVYRKLSYAMVPLSPALISRRLKLGKEDPAPHGLDIDRNGALWYCDAGTGWVCKLV